MEANSNQVMFVNAAEMFQKIRSPKIVISAMWPSLWFFRAIQRINCGPDLTLLYLILDPLLNIDICCKKCDQNRALGSEWYKTVT